MLRDLRGWPTPAPILAAAAALDFGVVTYMIVRRLHPPPPGSRAPPQVTRRMAAAVLVRGAALVDSASLTSYVLALFDADVQLHDGTARTTRKAPLLIRPSATDALPLAWHSP